jgi:hypothetical protein
MNTIERPPTALDRMHSAVQLAGFHYIACMKARPTNDDHHLTIGSSQYVFNSIANTPSNVLHSEFQRWAARVVLRDLIESFSLYLIELYQTSVSSSKASDAPMTAERFERRGLEDQLSAFANHFDVDEQWTTRLVAFNRARNCLAHRQGLVGDRDVTEGKYLVVRWLKADVSLTPGNGDSGPMAELIRGQLLAGQHASFSIEDKEKHFIAGSAITLDPDDVLEICQTFQIAAAAFYIP